RRIARRVGRRQRRRAAGRGAGRRRRAGAHRGGAGRARPAGRRRRADRGARGRGPRPVHRAPRPRDPPARRPSGGDEQGPAARGAKALGTIKAPRAVPTLLARLGDVAPGVRAAAGEALAARRERTATPRLFALVKRGDAGAASPLAALATPDLIPQIAELAGTVDDGVIAATLGDYVQRADVPDRLRLDVVRTIGHLAGAASTTALVDYI